MPSPFSLRTFGRIPSGESIEAWTLYGAGGLVLETISYGAIVTRLLTPDSKGRLADVVLGFDSLERYLDNDGYFGAMIGRLAGRIPNAHFRMDDKIYKLDPNDAPNHLHGGTRGFDRRIWTATPIDNRNGDVSLRLTYRSPDGEEGYPGELNVEVIYTVTKDNVFRIDSEAVADRPTPFGLTHHSYFNLAGEAVGTIADHEIQIHAEKTIAVDQRMAPLGRLDPVNPRNDLRKPRTLSKVIAEAYQNHGDLYLIQRDGPAGEKTRLVPAARLMHHGSGRVLEVFTTEMYLQLYTGSGLDGSLTGKSGTLYGKHAGVCMECEGYPDGANVPSLGDAVLRPGQPRRQTTLYAFSSTEANALSTESSL